MEDASYRICSRCVMDTTDPDILFDKLGVCNHCSGFDNVLSKSWFPNDHGQEILKKRVSEIKEKGRKQEYDCILGLSGGLDSSYLALAIKDSGLRPLVVHVDAGWNSELAVHNIEKVVKYCGYDLHTHVVDWEEIKDLQVAYLKAGVANQDVVQDHIFFATLYQFAIKNNIKYVVSGGNIATECVWPKAWMHPAMDSINLKAIHKRYGKIKLKHYKVIGFLEYFFVYPFLKGMSTFRPLDYMHYNKDEALRILKEVVGYKEYGRKHGESRFTRFFQNHYLPIKFNIDKRRPHLSSLILSGALSREVAVEELQKELYDQTDLDIDKAFVAKKLGMEKEDLDLLIYSPGRDHSEFKNWNSRYRLLQVIKRNVVRFLGRNVKTYS